MEARAKLCGPRAQVAIAGSCDMRSPAPVAQGRQEIEQTALRAAKITELVEEEYVHPQPARRQRAPRNTAAARANRSADLRTSSETPARPRNRKSTFRKMKPEDPHGALPGTPTSRSQ